jgi:hypothetical protein
MNFQGGSAPLESRNQWRCCGGIFNFRWHFSSATQVPCRRGFVGYFIVAAFYAWREERQKVRSEVKWAVLKKIVDALTTPNTIPDKVWP